MNHILENEHLSVTIASTGAEVVSIKDKLSGKELWWNGDPAFWAGHSPILFPACGGLWNGEYKYRGQTYRMPKHGFVRKAEFSPVAESGQGSLSFRLHDTEQTREHYPFAFILTITYTLKGRTLACNATVGNPSADEVLHYQIGGHPAVALPDYDKDAELAGYLRFETDGVPSVVRAGEQGCFGGDRFRVSRTPDGLVPISMDTFKDEALIFDKHQVKDVSVLRTDRKTEVCRIRHGAPVVLVWQMTGILCPYVCVEPWFGMPDRIGYSVDLDIRPYSQHAMPGEESRHTLWSIDFAG